MRISPQQSRFIAQSVRHHLGPDARIWLFGSRVDDRSRGGDLDLYIEAPTHALMDEVRCKLQLEEALDIPVDLIVRSPGDEAPIAKIAKTRGVSL